MIRIYIMKKLTRLESYINIKQVEFQTKMTLDSIKETLMNIT